MGGPAEIEIANLLYRYAELVDGGEFDAVGDLFEHADYYMGGTKPMRGSRVADAMRATVITYDGTPRTRHVMTNPIIEVDGDTATARSSYTVMQAADGLALQPILIGGYHDRFQRVDGVWRFAERSIRADLIGDLSKHIRIQLPPTP